MDIDFIRKRITELRLAKDCSEYQVSLDLGYSKGYIQSITSGHSLPSVRSLLDIFNDFNITPAEFFDEETPLDSPIIRQLVKDLRVLPAEDLQTILEITERFKYYREQKSRPSGKGG